VKCAWEYDVHGASAAFFEMPVKSRMDAIEQLERAAVMDLPADVARCGLAIDLEVEASFPRKGCRTARGPPYP